jgi:DNA-binding PadR family transcriptional regulator
VDKTASDPVLERGGRTRYYYEVTTEGIAALEKILSIHSSIWRGIQDLGFEKKAT